MTLFILATPPASATKAQTATGLAVSNCPDGKNCAPARALASAPRYFPWVFSSDICHWAKIVSCLILASRIMPVMTSCIIEPPPANSLSPATLFTVSPVAVSGVAVACGSLKSKIIGLVDVEIRGVKLSVLCSPNTCPISSFELEAELMGVGEPACPIGRSESCRADSSEFSKFG